MRNLLLSSVCVLLLAACTPGHYGRLTSADKQAQPLQSIFGDNFTSFLFKTNITIYGKEVSGLLVTKQMQAHDYRVIFTTELGMKLFDFEFKDSAFSLHYCVPQFNRPALLNTRKQDIETLLMNSVGQEPYVTLTDKAQQYTIIRTHPQTIFTYYFTENASGNMVKIEHSKKHSKKVIYLLEDYQDHFPNSISINHCDIKLQIELKLLKR